MSGQHWEPGDLAVATVRGVEGVRVMRAPAHVNYDWASGVTVGGTSMHHDFHVTDVRRLVVLDPETAPWFVETIRGYLKDIPSGEHFYPSAWQMLGWLADQIEAQTKPPKPPEPTGKYAAVEDTFGSDFVRLGNGPAPWMHNGSPTNRHTYSWDQIDVVKILSEGVPQ